MPPTDFSQVEKPEDSKNSDESSIKPENFPPEISEEIPTKQTERNLKTRMNGIRNGNEDLIEK